MYAPECPQHAPNKPPDNLTPFHIFLVMTAASNAGATLEL